MTPAALRAMRAAVGWSMRDVAEAAHVALATILKMEAGGRVSHRVEQRVQAAFQAKGVKSWRERGGTSVLILDQAPPPPATPADELRAMPWVTAQSSLHFFKAFLGNHGSHHAPANPGVSLDDLYFLPHTPFGTPTRQYASNQLVAKHVSNPARRPA